MHSGKSRKEPMASAAAHRAAHSSHHRKPGTHTHKRTDGNDEGKKDERKESLSRSAKPRSGTQDKPLKRSSSAADVKEKDRLRPKDDELGTGADRKEKARELPDLRTSGGPRTKLDHSRRKHSTSKDNSGSGVGGSGGTGLNQSSEGRRRELDKSEKRSSSNTDGGRKLKDSGKGDAVGKVGSRERRLSNTEVPQ